MNFLKISFLYGFILIVITIIIVYLLSLQITSAYSTSDPLSCPTQHLLDCYSKITFKIYKLNPGEKASDFKINITDNPRHIDVFEMNKKTMVRYLLPGEYRINVIFKNQNLGLYCAGISKAGESRLCDNISR